MKPQNSTLKLLAFSALTLAAFFAAYKDLSHLFKAQWRLSTIAMLVREGDQTPRDKGEYLLPNSYIYLTGMVTVSKPPAVPKTLVHNDTSQCLDINMKAQTGTHSWARRGDNWKWTTVHRIRELGENWKIGTWNIYPANFARMPLVARALMEEHHLDTRDGDEIKWCGNNERCREEFSCYITQPFSLIAQIRQGTDGKQIIWPAWMLVGIHETPRDFEIAFREEQSKPTEDWRARLWLLCLLAATAAMYTLAFTDSGVNPFKGRNKLIKLEAALIVLIVPGLQYLAFRFVTVPLVGYGLALLSIAGLGFFTAITFAALQRR